MKNRKKISTKAMRICGLNTDIDRIWKTSQLKKKLQDIIQNYPKEFLNG